MISIDFVAPVGTLLENAFWHGNENNPDLPVILQVQEGEKGHVLTIGDQGQGFDYGTTINKAKAGEKYFKNLGAGIREVNRWKWDIVYSPPGNVVHVLYPDAMLWVPPKLE